MFPVQIFISVNPVNEGIGTTIAHTQEQRNLRITFLRPFTGSSKIYRRSIIFSMRGFFCAVSSRYKEIQPVTTRMRVFTAHIAVFLCHLHERLNYLHGVLCHLHEYMIHLHEQMRRLHEQMRHLHEPMHYLHELLTRIHEFMDHLRVHIVHLHEPPARLHGYTPFSYYSLTLSSVIQSFS